MTKLTVSLSRAHRIAERLNGLMGEARKQATAKALAVTLQGPATQEQAERIRRNGDEAMAAVAAFGDMTKAHAAMRQAIAVANVNEGVSAMLATIEANKKLISLYGDLVATGGSDVTTQTLESLGEYVWPAATAYHAASVEVATLSRAAVLHFEQAKVELERENFSLNDRLSDVNAAMVDIDVPEGLRKDLGL